MGEGGLAPKPLGIVAGGDQEAGRDLGAHSLEPQEAGLARVSHLAEVGLFGTGYATADRGEQMGRVVRNMTMEDHFRQPANATRCSPPSQPSSGSYA